MKWIDRVRSCWLHDLSRYRRFTFADRPIGFVRPDAAAEAISIFPELGREPNALTFSETASDGALTSLLEQLSHHLCSRKLIPPLTGEMYAIRHWSGGPDLGCIDRAASLALGVRTYGVHLNAYVRQGDSTYMWVARRSMNQRYFPGLLDNLVAGGQPAGEEIWGHLEKEALEEAGIDKTLMCQAVITGQVAYRFDGPEGLVDSVAYAFDLEVPPAFRPQNFDRSIEDFYLLPVEEVVERLFAAETFKFNSALIIIDFILRHRAVSPMLLNELDRVRSLIYTPEAK